jgi:uncharacterized protein with von Willebrand factor type A (vWA) domain
VRHRFFHLDSELLRSIFSELSLQRVFNHLLLATGGDVEEAMGWLRFLQEQGHLDPDLDLDAFFEAQEARHLLVRDDEGALVLGSAGERLIRREAFEEIFSSLTRGAAGYHPVRSEGVGVEPLPEKRRYQFGDDLHRLDASGSLKNALKRTLGGLDLDEQDLEVFETEHLTACSTVVAIDISHSMILYGEDRITPAKKVALALTELITQRYPKDSLEIVLFGDRAERIGIPELPYIQAGPYHTNTREALQLARGLLLRTKQPNRQIFLVTDGKPSAITEGGEVYKNPYGLDMKIVNRTLEEADVCRRHRIVITTFMLATDPTLAEFVEKLTRVNRGRAYFASPYELGEFILADYIRNRRKRTH